MHRHLMAPLVAALALLPACSHTVAPAVKAPAAAHIASAPQRFGFLDLDGGLVGLDDYRNHPIVLAYMGTSGDSEREAVLLGRLAASYQAEGLVVIGAGEKATVGELRAFVMQQQIDFPFWQDPHGSEYGSAGFRQLPAIAFIDRNGQVNDRHDGFASRGELTAGIEAIVR